MWSIYFMFWGINYVLQFFLFFVVPTLRGKSGSYNFFSNAILAAVLAGVWMLIYRGAFQVFADWRCGP